MSVTIDRLGHQGEGIAEGPVFVPRTLPGEVIGGEIEDGRIHSPKILTPSPERVAPPCPHYRTCGGCALQHAKDDFVAAWKVDVVARALAARGIKTRIGGPMTSPPGSRRRAVLSGRRLKSGPVVGFHARASETVSAVPDCRVLDPVLLAAVPACADITAALGSRKREVRLTLIATLNGADVSISGTPPPDGQDWQTLAVLADRHDLARLAIDGDVIVTRRTPDVSFDGLVVRPPPGAFLQATPRGEAGLLSSVRRAVGPSARIADLFAGCGTFGLPLARGAEVHAVESEADMLKALDGAWRRHDGLKAVTTETRDLFRRRLEPDELARFDAVVIDPPRAGAKAQMQALAQSTVARIASVSCNPVTFARDARILCDGGYRLDFVEVVDQFRWSPHVELAAGFTREMAPW